MPLLIYDPFGNPLLEKVMFLSSLACVLVKIRILTAAVEVSGSIPEVSGKLEISPENYLEVSPEISPELLAIAILRYPWKFPESFPEANLRNVAMGPRVLKVIQK